MSFQEAHQELWTTITNNRRSYSNNRRSYSNNRRSYTSKILASMFREICCFAGEVNMHAHNQHFSDIISSQRDTTRMPNKDCL